MKQLFLLAVLFIAYSSFGQDRSVVVHKDPRIDVLMKKQSEVNNSSTRLSAKRRYAKGYRLIVISTNSRADAIAAKTKIYTYFPELKSYMWHQSPYFKVKVGNFTSRSEAIAYQKKLGTMFPAGVFLMNDTIEVKPEDAAKE